MSVTVEYDINRFPLERVREVLVGRVPFGGTAPLALMAGPCVIESREMAMDVAHELSEWSKAEGVPFVYKISYDKANRSSSKGFRGLGLAKGLAILAEIKERFSVPILTDVHSVAEVGPAAEVADVLQLPAFLCRQTDLVVALGESGRVVNLKKGQFLAPWDMRHVIGKVEETGNRNILLTERGASFGYNNLVADMRSLLIMRQFGYPVVFDATHSVQLPGGREEGTGGDGKWAPFLARAAVAMGCDGLFLETHREPLKALSDKDNMISLADVPPLWKQCSAIAQIARNGVTEGQK